MMDLLGPHLWPVYCHFIGDYVLQSSWMANNKTKAWSPVLAHAAVYTIPFAVLTQSWMALAVIFGTHVIIDHWRLARYVCWAKNFLAPPAHWPKSWDQCRTTGYGPDTPDFLAVWLMIITDNSMHILCNAAAISYL